jgi:hypothetical protein
LKTKGFGTPMNADDTPMNADSFVRMHPEHEGVRPIRWHSISIRRAVRLPFPTARLTGMP